MPKKPEFTKKQLEALENIPFSVEEFGDRAEHIGSRLGPALKGLQERGLASGISRWVSQVAVRWKATLVGNKVIIHLFPAREEEYLMLLLSEIEKILDIKERELDGLRCRVSDAEVALDSYSKFVSDKRARLKKVQGKNQKKKEEEHA